jgi:four helix bundle protein
MKDYRLALFLGELAWHAVTKMALDQRAVGLADQLFRSVGSIGANIAEGYSRRSGKDRVRFYEYALGSARESRHWYYTGRHALPDKVYEHRLSLLAEVARLLLSIVPKERSRNLAEEQSGYGVGFAVLEEILPMP